MARGPLTPERPRAGPPACCNAQASRQHRSDSPEEALPNESHPVVQRLEQLSDQWTEFATDAEARLLVWQATQPELSMIEAFFARESDAEAAQTPDFFLRLRAPFKLVKAHGYALREELITEYDTARPALEAEGIEAGWRAPHARQADDDVAALVRALSSFRAHHERDIELLLSTGDATGAWVTLLVCKRYGVKTFRAKRQKPTTIGVRAPKGFIDAVLHPHIGQVAGVFAAAKEEALSELAVLWLGAERAGETLLVDEER